MNDNANKSQWNSSLPTRFQLRPGVQSAPPRTNPWSTLTTNGCNKASRKIAASRLVTGFAGDMSLQGTAYIRGRSLSWRPLPLTSPGQRQQQHGRTSIWSNTAKLGSCKPPFHPHLADNVQFGLNVNNDIDRSLPGSITSLSGHC